MVHFKEHSKNSNQIVDINFKIGHIRQNVNEMD